MNKRKRDYSDEDEDDVKKNRLIPTNKRKLNDTVENNQNKKARLQFSDTDIMCIIKIQSFFRKQIAYLNYLKLSDEYAVTFKNKSFTNNTTLVGKELSKIKKRYIYTLLENNKWYCFDIRELYKHIKNNNKNPYTNNIIRTDQILQIYRLCKVLINKGYSIHVKNPIPVESRETVQIANFLQKLQRYDIYLNSGQLKKLQGYQIFIILSKLLLQFVSDYHIQEIYKFIKSNTREDSLMYMIDIISDDILELNSDSSELISHIISDIVERFQEEEVEYVDWDVSFITYAVS